MNKTSELKPDERSDWAKRYSAIRVARRNGQIKRQPCEVCGDLKTEGHHDDYSKPLLVRWLCRKHHRELHHGGFSVQLKPQKFKKKDPKLRVRVACVNRDFYLFKPPGQRNWHVKLAVPRHLRSSLGVKQIWRSTGTYEVDTARRIAALKIEQVWNGQAKEVPEDFATLGEIIDCYRDGARLVTDKEELSEQTINCNIRSLILIAETRFNSAGNRTRKKGSAENLSSEILTAELLEDFKRGWMLGIDRNDPAAVASAKNTVNAYIRQARSVLGAEYMRLYKDLRLPDLTGFREVKRFAVSSNSSRYVPIPQDVIDGMEQEVRSLRTSRPDIYLGFYFMLWLGMRISEVQSARLEWIEEWPKGARMAIVRRPYFRPKGIDGIVAVAPSLLADVKELSGAKSSLDYLIPGETMTQRKNSLGRDLSKLVRRHLGEDRQKTCHELRKHAISMVLMRTRSYVDALKFSRHADVRTLQNHYGTFLDDLPAITSSNWRDGLPVAGTTTAA